MEGDPASRRALPQPLHATATVRPAGGAGGRVLRLAIDDTSWTGPKRQWTPLVPDHGHLMHLFLVRDATLAAFAHLHPLPLDSTTFETSLDRKSTRLNSSHGYISYAVFCLKKKKLRSLPVRVDSTAS